MPRLRCKRTISEMRDSTTPRNTRMLESDTPVAASDSIAASSAAPTFWNKLCTPGLMRSSSRTEASCSASYAWARRSSSSTLASGRRPAAPAASSPSSPSTPSARSCSVARSSGSAVACTIASVRARVSTMDTSSASSSRFASLIMVTKEYDASSASAKAATISSIVRMAVPSLMAAKASSNSTSASRCSATSTSRFAISHSVFVLLCFSWRSWLMLRVPWWPSADPRWRSRASLSDCTACLSSISSRDGADTCSDASAIRRSNSLSNARTSSLSACCNAWISRCAASRVSASARSSMLAAS
mmetsp:Transcript_535/g.2096  ORF Transcript_535/g.2096 Transcript_535/m.2096 type:complete len:302 (-) Transcript_535:506-1411(-)